MNHHAARLTLTAATLLASVLPLLVPPAARAEHLPPPSEIVLRAGELPAGFAPIEEPGVPSLLPDSLARQAAASFRRDPERAAEPGMSYVRQVVLAFDEREATEYLPRFRDLMLRHQGYAAVASSETDFRLTRTRNGETNAAVGTARGEVLVVTTVAGQAGTVSPEDAASLTGIAVARVPGVDQTSAALSASPSGRLALENAHPGGRQVEYPSIEDKGRWPDPTVSLPPPPALDVVAQRSQQPAGDPALDGMVQPEPNRQRPPDLGTNLVAYTAWIAPLIDEFWARALGQTGHIYSKPRIVMVTGDTLLFTPCRDGDGYPAPVLEMHYCSVNATIYIYEPFLRDDIVATEDWRQRDFVIAAFLAHEWGHHIQNIHGYKEIEQFNAHNHPDLLPLITRQHELQADCFAGLFTRYARDSGWLDIGDLNEAQDAMLRIGDHYIDEPGHHGTPEQRKEWFMRGYVHYSYRGCDAW